MFEAAAIAACATLLLAWLSIPVLSRFAIDEPNERSSHDAPVARSGGTAVLAGTAASMLYLAFSNEITYPNALIIAALIFAAIGFIDDLTSLPVAPRLGVQAIAAILMSTATGIEVGLLMLAIQGFLIVGFVNAFNFMDGINGVSAATTTFVSAWYFWLFTGVNAHELAALCVVLAGSAVGFSVPNLMGRLFLGDVGSYFLGASLMFLALAAWARGISPVLAAAPLVLYTFEASWAIVGRGLRGARIGQPHRDHVYQRLVDAGMPHSTVSGVVVLASASVCFAAVLWPVSPVLSVLLITCTCISYALLPRLPLSRAWGTA